MHNYHLLCSIDTQTTTLWLIDHWKPLGHVYLPLPLLSLTLPLFFSSLFSPYILPDSLRPHGLQHARLTVLHSLPEFVQTHIHWVSDAIQPLLLLPSIFPSITVFSTELALCIRWPKYWSFSFSISPFNEYPGLTSFKIDWFDLLVVQGTLKSLLQPHSLKASILQHAAFFMTQLSHPYITPGKNHSFDSMDLCQWGDVSAF